jgi:hypothetical protein
LIMGNKIVASAVVIVTAWASTVSAQVGIRPAFVEVKLDAGRPAGSFFVANMGTTEVRFRIDAVHFTITEQGTLRTDGTGKYSLAPWIRFNPRELTLPPQTERAVRFAIIPKGPLPPGEYYAAMSLQSLEENKATGKVSEDGATTMEVRAIVSVLAPIFGTVGEVTYGGEIKDVRVEVVKGAVALKTLIAATGGGRLGAIATYDIIDASGQALVENATLRSAYIMRGTEQWLTAPVTANVPPGQYTVRVTCGARHLAQPLVREVTVVWPDVPQTNPNPVANSAGAAPATNQPGSPKD